eukprot:NODE_304_length_11385_cov_0.300018.p3 type:complete len:198 gc:universal NODE_304_length_11385_cov_0.300018:2734-3327(+)
MTSIKQLILQLLADQFISLSDFKLVQSNYDNPKIRTRYPLIFKLQQLRLIEWALKLQIHKKTVKTELISSHDYSAPSLGRNCLSLLHDRIIELDKEKAPDVVLMQVKYEKASYVRNSDIPPVISEINEQRNSYFKSFNDKNRKSDVHVNLEMSKLYEDARSELESLKSEQIELRKEILTLLPEKLQNLLPNPWIITH